MGMLRFRSFLIVNVILEFFLVTSFSRWNHIRQIIPKSTIFSTEPDNFSNEDSGGDDDDDDDAMDFESLVRKGIVNPMKLGTSDSNDRTQFLKKLMNSRKRDEDDYGDDGQSGENVEQIFRKYPFHNMSLPVLNDCNNYYSGKYKDVVWHQNADQVFVYIPLKPDMAKSDIKVDFAVKNVKVSTKGEEILQFQCVERIIPDGSFWVIEENADGVKYIQLDLEKRFRMINWNHLLCENTRATGGERDLDSLRSETLEKLIAANKGLSRLTGKPAETLEDMTAEEIESVTSDISEEPEILSETESDEIPQEFIDAEFEETK